MGLELRFGFGIGWILGLEYGASVVLCFNQYLCDIRLLVSLYWTLDDLAVEKVAFVELESIESCCWSLRTLLSNLL